MRAHRDPPTPDRGRFSPPVPCNDMASTPEQKITEAARIFVEAIRQVLREELPGDRALPPPAPRQPVPRWLTVAEAVEYSKSSTSVIGDALRDGSLRGSQTVRG